jgi:hypothetical protein
MKQEPGPEGVPDEGNSKDGVNDSNLIDGKPIFVGDPVTPPVGNVDTTGDPAATTPTVGVINDITAPGTIAEGVMDGENGATPTVKLVGTAVDPEVICVDVAKPVIEVAVPPIPLVVVAPPAVVPPVVVDVEVPVVPTDVPTDPIAVAAWNSVDTEDCDNCCNSVFSRSI